MNHFNCSSKRLYTKTVVFFLNYLFILIICQLIVYLLDVVQNNKICMVKVLK
jgi:hypothetical protein